MSNENFDSLKELQDAEDNQVLSRIDKPIPNVSDFSEYVTPQEVTDGLTYKATKRNCYWTNNWRTISKRS